MLCNGEAYEHGATFALALLIAYIITVLTQVFKDQERFQVRDLVERIELQKIRIKLQMRLLEKQRLRQAASAGMSPDQQLETARGQNLLTIRT